MPRIDALKSAKAPSGRVMLWRFADMNSPLSGRVPVGGVAALEQ